MAAADVVLDELSKPGFLADVQRRAALLDKGLRDLQNAYPKMIEELRGRGFLRGIKFADDCNVASIMAGLRAQHVLAVPAAENTLRLLPPLIISEDEIDIVLGALDHILETNKT